LLPPDVALENVIEQIDLPRLETLWRSATLATTTADLRENLRALL
jgi:hypothetical protein